MERFTFKDKEYFNGTLNTGKAIHKILTEIRVDNETGEEMRFTTSVCGQESTGFYGSNFRKYEKDITCKKCLKKEK